MISLIFRNGIICLNTDYRRIHIIISNDLADKIIKHRREFKIILKGPTGSKSTLLLERLNIGGKAKGASEENIDTLLNRTSLEWRTRTVRAPVLFEDLLLRIYPGRDKDLLPYYLKNCNEIEKRT